MQESPDIEARQTGQVSLVPALPVALPRFCLNRLPSSDVEVAYQVLRQAQQESHNWPMLQRYSDLWARTSPNFSAIIIK